MGGPEAAPCLVGVRGWVGVGVEDKKGEIKGRWSTSFEL